VASVILGVIALQERQLLVNGRKSQAIASASQAAAVHRVAQKQARIGFDRQSLPRDSHMPSGERRLLPSLRSLDESLPPSQLINTTLTASHIYGSFIILLRAGQR
jgi:hypothetical protein